MDRNRPITILGNPRISDASTLSAQVLNADTRGLHASSAFPLPTTSVDFQSWQNSGGGTSAAAASPFYNLPRFPGYYQFPQINPAYLPTLWPQAPWQSSTTAQQIQQHQLHQQQKQNHPLMFGIISIVYVIYYIHCCNACHDIQQSNPVDASWIGASMSADLNSPSAAPVSSFHPPAATRQISQTQPLSRSVNVGVTQNAASVSGFPSNFTSGMMPSSANLLSSFQTMYQQQQQQQRQQLPRCPVAVTAATGVTSDTGTVTALSSNFPLPRSSSTMQSQFPVQFSSTIANVPTASSVANVKRMECDSSVPSPPKTQHQVQQNNSLPFGQCTTANTNTACESRSPVNNSFAAVAKDAKSGQTVVSEEIKSSILRTEPSSNVKNDNGINEETETGAIAPSTSTIATNLSKISSGTRTSNGGSDEDGGVLSGSGKNSPSECVAESANMPLEKTWKEHSRSRSPSHHSPKRRGHGHSESSRSISPVIQQPTSEVSVKKYRKSNEVARLLNDLTEGAWMNLAGRSNNRHTIGVNDRNKNTSANHSSDDDTSEDSDEEGSVKKSKRRSSASNRGGDSYRNSTEKPKRGRPKGSKKRTQKKSTSRRRKYKRSNDSGSLETDSDDNDNYSRTSPKKVGRPSTANRDDSRAVSSKRGRRSGTTAHATFPRKRGRSPVKAQDMSESESDSSNSSASSTASSFSLRHSKVATPKQRKVGTAPTSSAGRSGYSGRGRGLGRKGKQKRVGRPSASDKRLGVKRRRKNSSSSVESASGESTSDDDNVSSRKSFDRSAYHNPEEQCGAKLKCKMPQGNNVNWIQCDSCDVWFHRDCIGSEVDENSEFHCGCNKKTNKRRGR
uniref:J domain-containing protein n=1 Tax=Syphacia muris TaxID=451379 RepID=A0A0N5ABT8_9BILA